MPLTQSQADDQQALQALALEIAAHCPDMRQQARQIARQILDQHSLGTQDPDHVYLNSFDNASTSPRTFSGWQHHEKPFQSLTLPQLVMHRFDAQSADNADLLSYRTGFYSDGLDKDLYDEHNEVALDPRQVLEYFWQIDFSQQFKANMEQFWLKHHDDFRTLAKAMFLSKALEACKDHPGSALASSAAVAAQALAGGHYWPPTLAQLRELVPPGPGVRLCTFDIGGHVATDILRIELQSGAQMLYMPGETDGLQLFENKAALYLWVLNHNNHADNRARFASHFALPERGERDSAIGLNHLIDLLYEGWGRGDYSAINQHDHTIGEDAFSWLRDKARQRMQDDAQWVLHSNEDLRKQLWIGYLKAFGTVFGPMAAVDWHVALAVVGAGMAEMGLNVDQALNGRTTAERQQGVSGAIIAGINVLFNAGLLHGAVVGEAGEIGAHESAPEHVENPEPEHAGAQASTAQIDEWVPQPLRPPNPLDPLDGFESNVILTGEPGSGTLAGIYSQQQKFYVEIDGQAYQVRHVVELKTWVIVDPENEFSWATAQTIRLDSQGQWQLVERMGLDGGWPLKALKIFGRKPSGPQLPTLAPNIYEIAQPSRALLHSVSDDALSGQLASLDEDDAVSAEQEFRNRRDQLAADAASGLASAQLPARPNVPELSPNTSPKQLLRAIYANSDGLVIGEAHSAIGSKRLLIDNMRELRKLNVKTLYMEHYQTDFQQPDLDTFNRTGKLSEALDAYISNQDRGHFTDPTGRYNFRQVLIKAQQQGLRIQSIDCMASYRQAWLDVPPPLARTRMMNFYAGLIIDADQALHGAGKWVALVGNTHANSFEGVPGISELQGAIGLRVEDVAIGQPDAVDVDPGLDVVEERSTRHVQSDLRLRAAVKPASANVQDLESSLRRPGDYAIEEQANGDRYLVNRGRDGSLRRTQIKRDGRYLYIERPDWPTLNGRRFTELSELYTQLMLRGMSHIVG